MMMGALKTIKVLQVQHYQAKQIKIQQVSKNISKHIKRVENMIVRNEAKGVVCAPSFALLLPREP